MTRDDKPPTRPTTQFGRPLDENQKSLTAGPRGPVLMQDVHLVEKTARFNRERIPERVVHAKGYRTGSSPVRHTSLPAGCQPSSDPVQPREGGASVDCEPNSFGGPVAGERYAEPPMPADGDGKRRDWFAGDDPDRYGQPRLLWNEVLDEGARQRLGENIVVSRKDSPERVQRATLAHRYKMGEDLGIGVELGLGWSAPMQAAK